MGKTGGTESELEGSDKDAVRDVGSVRVRQWYSKAEAEAENERQKGGTEEQIFGFHPSHQPCTLECVKTEI